MGGPRLSAILFLALIAQAGVFASITAEPARPISVHPENPKYFLFRGKPLALIAATEHYGSVVNRRFDFERYFQEAADKKQTVTRLFLLFRELQSARNPYSPLKPDSPDYVAPYPRTGPGKAIDGEPKYDLDQWNPVYFQRLQRFLRVASDLGIVVEMTLFSNSYGETAWSLNPLRSENNINGLRRLDWTDYTTLRDSQLFQRQAAYVRRIIQETNGYDNVYYEVCNEPGGGVKDRASTAEVNQWQAAVGKVIRDELAKLPNQHLIFGSEAFSYTPQFHQGTDSSFMNGALDAVNIHPLPETRHRERVYQMGNFMSKELMLSEFRDFCRAVYSEKKPVVMDEDNAASLYRDDTGWTIHRKRAWTALFSGAHYDYIDFSITVGSEAGTEESREKVRTWMKHLSEFFHSFDFVRSQPLMNWVDNKPEFVIDSSLAIPGEEYIVYLADAREVGDIKSGEAIQAKLLLRLPAGRYQACFYSPVTGNYSPALTLSSNGKAEFDLPAFRDDLVLHIRKTGNR